MPLPNPDHTADDDDTTDTDSKRDRESESEAATGNEHFLEESAGLFGKTIYHCRHCETRSPDRAYFTEISCPPTIDAEPDPDSDDPHMQK